jgi:hypothetical protein
VAGFLLEVALTGGLVSVMFGTLASPLRQAPLGVPALPTAA